MMDNNWKRRRKGKFVFVGLAMIIGFLLLVALLQYLWNVLMTDIFNLKMISYWQALGLLVLSKILFGGGLCKPRGGFRKRFPKRDGNCAPLDEEERARFRDEWRRRFGGKCVNPDKEE